MDESRKAFERWWEVNYHNGNPPRFGWEAWREVDGYKVDDDESELDGMWQAWQASREAIEIEPLSHFQAVNAIPRSQTSLTDAVKIGYLMCAEVAGIKVKE
ncbi:hypothetical protein ABKV35_00180 [Enterobacter kobei]|uniref:hypothetical protein n=1 Tax=Enterobacter kobei TaxID=208224 RepID=UPI0032B0047F